MKLKQFDIQQKILWHYDKIAPWLDEKVVYPITIEIDPTNVCNERCTWCCWKDHREDKTTMSEEFLDKIIRNLAKVGVNAIIWTGGGEPLINRYVPKFMSLSKSLGMENSMFTNGILLTSEKIPTIIKSCAWVRISLGAATAETFSKCQGELKDFYKIIDNIKELVKVKKELNSDITIGVGMLVDVDNYHELYQEAMMSKELGVDFFQGKPSNQMNSGDLEWWLNLVIPQFKKAKELETEDFKILVAQYTKDKYGEDSTIFMNDQVIRFIDTMDSNEHECHVHNFVTAITANGNVSFCKNLRDRPEFVIGNLKTQTMEEIFNGERRKEVERKINDFGCHTFCQNRHLNEMLKFLKHPIKRNHPNFL